MFQVHRSNRAERLLEELSRIVRRPAAGAGALSAEVVVVQSKGMERWLSMELATRRGVWAGARFPFPRAFVEEAHAAVLGEAAAAGRPPFDREHLSWAIAAQLPALLGQPGCAPLRSWVGEERERVVPLAERIAHVFDQYAVYRPQMVLGWERGAEPDDWQARLWRRVAPLLRPHPAARQQAFEQAIERLARGPVARPPALPPRVCVFGVNSLPPAYLHTLALLGQLMEVHVLLLSASRQWLGDRPAWRQLALLPGSDGDEDAGNPLSASLGAVGQGLIEQLYGGPLAPHEDDRDLFDDPGQGTLLATLQSDLLADVHRGGRRGGGGTAGRARSKAPREEPGSRVRTLDPADDSVQVHACHGPVRELEVLRDRLLDLLARDPSLSPRHVVVMTPDIERYAPLIDAVFGAALPGDGHAGLPYRIADRPAAAGSAAVEAFLAALSLLPGRLRAGEVLDLLWREPVGRRAGIGGDDMGRVRGWVERAGIRWGADAADRARAGQPAFEENTWRFGLRRLLLGLAAGDDERALFAGVAPLSGVEGGDGELLGRVVHFVEELLSAREALAQPRPLSRWRPALEALLDQLIDDRDDHGEGAEQVRSALASMAEAAAAAGFAQPLSLETVRRLLAERIGESRGEHAYLAGGITFCAMLPMRSVPFRVVALVGMNDGEFPRPTRAVGFDRVAARPSRGDRIPRDEDRYLFLEALLSARQHLIITYEGQSPRDQQGRPPSAVVGELLDTIDDGFRQPGGGRPRPQVVVRHPLQPFSARYFGAGGDRRLFSYALDLLAAAERARGERAAAPPFVPGRLPPPAEADAAVSLDELVHFLRQPARTLLSQRLGLRFPRADEALEEREPLDLARLLRYQVGNRLVGWIEDGIGEEEALVALRAAGALPLGALGQRAFEALWPEARALALAAAGYRQGAPRSVSVDLALPGPDQPLRLTGALNRIWPTARLELSYGAIGARRLIELWARHLVLQLVAPPEHPRASVLLGRAAGSGVPTEARLAPLPASVAQAALADLVRLHREGLRQPLPLFPEAALAYVEELARLAGRGDDPGLSRATALGVARRRFEPTAVQDWPAESEEPAVRLLFAGADALSWQAPEVGDFATLAERVFQPLWEHLAFSARPLDDPGEAAAGGGGDGDGGDEGDEPGEAP